MTVSRLRLPIAAGCAAIALALPCAVPAAAPARTVDLRTQPSFEIVGARPIDFAGSAVAAGGDVNGDGVDDVVVAAPPADAPGRPNAGAVYVVFGRRRTARAVRARPRARIAAGAPAQGFRILGPTAKAELGLAVAGAGDVNGDGLDDVVVNADVGPMVQQGNVGAPPVHAGAVYVVFGRRGGGTVDLAHLGTAGMSILGPTAGVSAQFGRTVAGGRDVDGDGRPDLVITDVPLIGPLAIPPAPRSPIRSSAYVIFGGGLRGGQDVHVDALGDAGYRLDGEQVGPASLAQDMNGDGRAEVVVGDNTATPDAQAKIRVAFGRAGHDPVDLADLGTGGFSVLDARGLTQTGTAVQGGGDVNGDGRGDLVAANVVGPGFGQYAPAATVVFGAPSADPVWMDRPGPRILNAIAMPTPAVAPPKTGGRTYGPGPNALEAVSIVDDADGDGLQDVLVGAIDSPRGRQVAGSAFLFRGRRSPGTFRLTGAGAGRVVRMDGAYAGDVFGTEATSAGDFDDDGHPDLLISGASSTRNGRLRAGAAWVLSGVRP